jgi:putative endonuclease
VKRRRGFVPVEAWSDPRHVRGVAGEHAAMAWLAARGWQVEAHRFRAGRHDIDLVVRRDHLVAFVEVKTRAGDRFGHPVLAIGWQKRRAIAWAAEVWMSRFGRPGDRYRFDVVSVWVGSGHAPSVEVLENAWQL